MAGKASTADVPGTGNGQRQRVHIRIAYQGRGEPGPLLAERCETLVHDLALETDVGKPHEHKAGGGSVDIRVLTRSANHTIRTAWKIVNALGLAARATIQIDDGKAARR